MSFKPDPAPARKFRAASRRSAQVFPESLPPILYLTDPARSPDQITTTRHLPRGSAVIYRHFGAPERSAIANELRKITWRIGAKLLLGNDPKLALEANADGVHWPEARMDKARYWKNRFALMTAAAHSRAAIHRAAQAGLNAALVSTVFPSTSASANAPSGVFKLRELAKNSPLPIYALGGVTAHNAGRISSVGGIASISGIEQAFGA